MSNNSVNSIRFLSWNVKGTGHPIKRSRVLLHLKHLKTDIAFIQETHMRNTDHVRLRKSWVSQVFHSTFNSKARGVAILIHRRTQFIPTSSISDPNGRYLIVTGTIQRTPVLLVNVYAPNFDALNTHRLIFGGDLNCVINTELDRSSPRLAHPSYMSRAFADFVTKRMCWRMEVS